MTLTPFLISDPDPVLANLKAIASISRDDSGRGTIRLKHRPETLAVSQPFMALFRNM